MNRITINGKTFFEFGDISIVNGRVRIGGKDVTPDGKEIKISIVGDVDRIDVDMCDELTITGNAGSVHTTSGDVTISGHVHGGVQTMSGDVDCMDIKGSISTMSGDIKHRKV